MKVIHAAYLTAKGKKDVAVITQAASPTTSGNHFAKVGRYLRDGYKLKFAGTSTDFKSPAIKWLWMHGKVGHMAPLARGFLRFASVGGQ